MEQITHLSSGIPGVRLIDAEYNRFSFPRHFHLEYHIGLLLQGRHRYAAGGERRLAGAGDALLMAPESIHDGSSAGEEGYRIRVLALDADWLERASRDFSDGRRGAPRLTSSLVRDERLQQRLRQLHLGMLGGAAALENRLALEEHLWQALACLLSLGSSLRLEEGDRQGFGRRDWTRLRDWLESRLEYPPNLEELAAFCGLSPWQVLRRFRRHCGLPPHQWLTQLRLERALPLVLRGEQPLSQVAQQFGFYDQAHFSRLFRRTYGLPPARLRQR